MVLAAALEVLTGVALIAYPGLVADLLFSAGLFGGGIAVGRVAGLGLLSLGLACWPGGDGATAQATKVLFTYNLLVASYLGYLGVGGGFAGLLLWPAFVLHALLTVSTSAPRIPVPGFPGSRESDGNDQ